MKNHSSGVRCGLVVAAAIVLPACDVPEPRATTGELSPSPTAVTMPDAPSEKMKRITTMFNRYRQEAFANVPSITPAEIRETDGRLVLVDCRSPEERAVSGIEGAISRDTFEANLESYRDRRVVTYCTIGYRSGVYAKELNTVGFNVHNLVGGVLAWAHADAPFVTPDGESTRRVHVYGRTWDILPDSHESVYEGKTTP